MYLERTSAYRHDQTHDQLLLSFQRPFKPVSSETISRWSKSVLKSAGIDVDQFSAHSTRSASTSCCKTGGLSLSVILKAAGWASSETFASFYDKPLVEPNFGSTLLELSTGLHAD